MEDFMIEAVKRISDIGAFGLVVFMIMMGFKFLPRLIELWTRGVTAMEKIADDMRDFRIDTRETQDALKEHQAEVSGNVSLIRGDIASVKQDVIRVEGKVDRMVR